MCVTLAQYCREHTDGAQCPNVYICVRADRLRTHTRAVRMHVVSLHRRRDIKEEWAPHRRRQRLTAASRGARVRVVLVGNVDGALANGREGDGHRYRRTGVTAAVECGGRDKRLTADTCSGDTTTLFSSSSSPLEDDEEVRLDDDESHGGRVEGTQLLLYRRARAPGSIVVVYFCL